MQQLPCQLDQLCQAYEQGNWRDRYYLDSVTGRVVLVTEAVRAELQEFYDRVGEYQAADHLATADLLLAHAVEMDDTRYWKVPVRPSEDWVHLRDAFAAGVETALQRLLWLALDNDNSDHFERLLTLDDAEGERWRAYRAADAERALRKWLNALGVEPVQHF